MYAPSLSPVRFFAPLQRFRFHFGLAALLALALAACSPSASDPGPLEGSWRMIGAYTMTITFRKGEAFTEGAAPEKVSYQQEGNDVIVTYLEGSAKGEAVRYTIMDAQTARTDLGTLKKVP